MSQPLLRPVLLGCAALLLAACGGKSNVREPTELHKIESPAFKPSNNWSASTGGSGKVFATLKVDVQPDALFAADVDGKVYAFDPQTGKQIWRAKTEARVSAGPAVVGDLVLVGTLDAEVIALKRADGTPRWRAKVSSEVMAPPAGDGHVVVVRTVDGFVQGLSTETGERLWIIDRSVPNLTLRGLSEPLVVGGHVYIGMDNGRLLALSLETGAVQWEQAVAVPTGRTELDRLTDIDASMLPGDRSIYAVSFGGELVSLDADSGEVQWRRSIKSYNNLAQVGSLIVVTDDAGTVWAMDAATGAAVWKQEGLAYRKLSPAGSLDGYVVVGDYEGYLHWLDPKDGKIVARSRAGGDPIRSSPVAGDKLLYVMNIDGKISAVSIKQ